MVERCSFYGCNEPICEEDKWLPTRAAKYCKQHYEMAEDAMENPENAYKFFLAAEYGEGES